tara:strand:- start:72 stop:266 length:195 start_codon:yes stop_codon:yes gene_type:complete
MHILTGTKLFHKKIKQNICTLFINNVPLNIPFFYKGSKRIFMNTMEKIIQLMLVITRGKEDNTE